MGLRRYERPEFTLGKRICFGKKPPKIKISARHRGGGGKKKPGEVAGGEGACNSSPQPCSICRRQLLLPFSMLAFKLAMVYGNK